MEEHAKKALKHDTKVLGKTVPTMLIIGLFLVGGGSAALLSSFGTVTGDAEVDQAVVLNGESAFSFDTEQTAGETEIETRTLQSNADVPTEIGFDTSCKKGGGTSTSIEGTTADFTGECKGIDTEYVEYFDKAGHDFSDYSSPSADDANVVVSDSDDLQTKVGGASQGDTVLVKGGSYSGTVDVTTSDLTIVAANPPNSSDAATVSGASNGFDIEATGVTVKGFEVMADVGADGSNARGIDVLASGATVESNLVHDVRAEERPIGIHVWADSDVSNAKVINNYVEGVEATQLGPFSGREESKAKGIALDGQANEDFADNVEISQNTVKNIGSQSTALASAVNIYGGAKDFDVNSNVIGSVDHKVATDSPYDLGVYVSGYGEGNYGADAVVTENNFVSTDSDQLDVATFDSAGTLNAPDNWFGTNGNQTGPVVDASWKLKSDTTIEPGTTDEFGIVNEFAINLESDTYSLTTSITPVNGEPTTS